jgi:hypothetical protein
MNSRTWCSTLKQNYHLLVPILLFVAFCFYCFRFFVDDTYINFIAAKNLIEHGHLSASLDNHVNPTTANFHMLLASLVYAVTGADFIEVGIKILGLLAGVQILVLVNSTLRNHRVEKHFRFIALVYLATSFPFILWAMSAMDTVFDGLFIAVACYLWFQDLSTYRARSLFLLATALLVLARLDYAIISVILVGAFVLTQGISKALAKQIATFYALPVVLILFGLKAYYGTIVPTPIVKASLTLPAMIQNFLNFGGLYFLHFCRLNLNILSILSLVFVVFWSFKNLRDQDQKSIALKLLAIAIATAAYIGYIMSQGSVHMMFAFRFYTPLLPLLSVLLGFALFHFASKKPFWASTKAAHILTAIILGVDIPTYFYGYYKNLNFSEIPGGDFTGMKNNNIRGWILLHEGMRHAGIYFGSIVPPGSKIFLGVAGILPYFMDKLAYDNGLLGVAENWRFDYVLNGCNSVNPVPTGFIRHEYKPVSPDTLYYPNSSWCLRQVQASNQPRLHKVADDRLSQLPIHDITGFEGILDMAGDLDARYFVENKMWDEMVALLNKLNSLSDTTTGRRELTGYGQFLPDEYRPKLNFLKPTETGK